MLYSRPSKVIVKVFLLNLLTISVIRNRALHVSNGIIWLKWIVWVLKQNLYLEALPTSATARVLSFQNVIMFTFFLFWRSVTNLHSFPQFWMCLCILVTLSFLLSAFSLTLSVSPLPHKHTHTHFLTFSLSSKHTHKKTACLRQNDTLNKSFSVEIKFSL